MELSYRNHPSDLVRVYEWLLVHDPGQIAVLRNVRWILVLGAFVLGTSPWLISEYSVFLLLGPLCAGGVWFATKSAFFRRWVGKLLAREALKDRERPWESEKRACLDEAGVSVTSEVMTMRLEWPQVSRIVDLGESVLVGNREIYCVLPVAAAAESGSPRDDFVDQLRAWHKKATNRTGSPG